MKLRTLLTVFFAAALLVYFRPAKAEEPPSEINARQLVLVAGGPSHSTGEHEHRAGVLLMEQCLEDVNEVETQTVFGGWPENESTLDDADAIYMFLDGGGGHSIVQDERLELMQQFINDGTSLGMMHYAVEVPEGNGGKHFKEWIGGYYETYYSVNPIWEAEFEKLPNHPISRGVEPFSAEDEWYFNIRFREDKLGVTPLLVTTPSDEVREGPYVHPEGPYDHIIDQSGEPEIMSWVVERKDGGRGFGFTGGHFHENWGIDGFRTFVLNATVWLSGAKVPQGGVQCEVTEADLQENLDE